MNENILQHYSEEEQFFVKRMLEFKELVLESDIVKSTSFLTMREQQIIKELLEGSVAIRWIGGYEQAERKIALLASREELLESFTDEDYVTKLFIKYNRRFGKVHHRATLGSVLSLGIDRKVIGDIIITDKKSYLIVEKGMTDLITQELEKIGRTRVELRVTSDEIPVVEEQFVEKIIFVKSLRIDNLLSYALNISRESTNELIDSRSVQMNWQTVTDRTKEYEEGAVISVRGHGRTYVDEITAIRNDGKYKLKLRQLV